jgi:hypothetical protein
LKNALLFFFILFTTCLLGCEEKDKPSPVPEPSDYSGIETISLYAIDSDAQDIMQITVENDEKLTLKTIVSLVIQNLDEKVEVASTNIEDGKAVVTFSNNTAPIKNCDEKTERLILECFANSILDNLEECSAVIFRSKKGAYKGENFSFGKYEVYATK